MQSKLEGQFIKRLNELPEPVKQILTSMRTIDVQILKLTNNIQDQRQYLLLNLMDYQKNKTIQRYIEKEKLMKEEKSLIKRSKNYLKKKQRQKNYSLQKQEMKNGGSSKKPFYQQHNPEKRSQLSKLYKIIDVMQGKLLYLSRQKMQLSQKLYNFVHKATQDVENNMLAFLENFKEPQNKLIIPRKGRKDKRQQFIQSQPKYCYCKRPSFGLMVQCSNQNCQISWFHSECIGERSRNTEEWYCKDCCNYFIKTRKG